MARYIVYKNRVHSCLSWCAPLRFNQAGRPSVRAFLVVRNAGLYSLGSETVTSNRLDSSGGAQ